MPDSNHTPDFSRGDPVPAPRVDPAPEAQPPGAPAFPGTLQTEPRRRRWRTGLLSGGVGALTALAILAGAAAVGPALGGLTATAPTTTTQPTTTSPATTQPGTTQPGTTQPRTTQGATTATGQTATEAQSRGVVLITTTVSGGSGAGTGMIIDAAGLILTNYHVVQGSTSVEVTVASTGRSFTATVVGHDAEADVALLKVDATGLATVTLDDDPVAVGDAVTAVGNAQGQDYLTAASGAITDTDDTVTVSNDSAAGSETLTGVYVSDAAAQPGDSGGPLFDAETEVTGMTTAGQQTYAGPRGRTRTTTTTVATYAIPIARAMAIVSQIRAGQETDEVRIGANAYLGVMVEPSGAASAATAPGVGVSSVTSGDPAAEAGLTAGSTITAIGGSPVTSQAELAAALATRNPGDTVSVSWLDAAGNARSAQVTLAESPVN